MNHHHTTFLSIVSQSFLQTCLTLSLLQFISVDLLEPLWFLLHSVQYETSQAAYSSSDIVLLGWQYLLNTWQSTTSLVKMSMLHREVKPIIRDTNVNDGLFSGIDDCFQSYILLLSNNSCSLFQKFHCPIQFQHLKRFEMGYNFFL